MKSITIQQPYASLVAYGEKTIEFRTWRTDYRGALAICASSRRAGLFDDGREIPHGVVVATCLLKNIRPFTPADLDQACLDSMPTTGGYAWELGLIREVHPLKVKGRQNLYDIDFIPELIDELDHLDHVDLFASLMQRSL